MKKMIQEETERWRVKFGDLSFSDKIGSADGQRNNWRFQIIMCDGAPWVDLYPTIDDE
jgi:hypothetical protein